MWKHLCITCMGLIYLVLGLFFNMYDCCLFPLCVLSIIPLMLFSAVLLISMACSAGLKGFVFVHTPLVRTSHMSQPIAGEGYAP